MPDRRRAHCQNCGGHRDVVGDISWRGRCKACSYSLLLENIDGLHTKTGVPWQRWRFGQARSLLGQDAANVLFGAGAFNVPLDESKADA